MKKGNKTLFLSLATISILTAPLFAVDPTMAEIFDDENMSNERIRNLQNQADLNHLFENSKFPVDDYIYKAGKRQPNQDQNLTEILKELEKLGDKQQNALGKQNSQNFMQQAQEQDITAEQERMMERAKEKQAKLQSKQEQLKQEMAIDSQKAYKKRMEKLMRAQILANRNNEVRSINQNSSKFGVDSFSNQKSIDISTNEHMLYRTIRAGRMIPAILTTAISSDLSGIVTAQIEQDIYASMGRAVLIPRGSKAIGFYTNNTKIGHERLEIRWREIITPQGINIMLTDAIVADNMGMAGAVGAINNKYWERYGIAYSISTLTNGIMLGIASKMNTNGSANNQYATEMYSNAKSDISSIVQDIMQQQSQIKPTIEIRSGSRIFLVPTNHMWFSKPKNGEVLMQYFKD
ncbi:TPA: DNA type IV secretion system protein ComB10 [Campylobacter fetus subsp. venerealis]|nr:DNA type IV secretion system protein ComB10 [Campylobacter fetus subsp. venerealis]HDX6254570.1 DNA type IV secretion system protein ComB10 [Campylobacter fetus subsp. venerealis]HDX6258440.1 DNA type IV secretion system protein ComB10 [Campylobacter fetus subsp. venerealis]HDX6262332.1 DNA type IV secretion system protein ComB10 [Campylobacter fetus subsp. venerealis]HDX6264350.1 DNA type IV secretion system protein ComB10 [Campylobacter fetus subsp. venerealis]